MDNKFIVQGKKSVINLQLLGAITNGNCIIPISNGLALRFTRNNKFKTKNGRDAHMVLIEILNSGIGEEIKPQNYQRSKIIKETVVKEIKAKIPEIKKGGIDEY